MTRHRDHDGDGHLPDVPTRRAHVDWLHPPPVNGILSNYCMEDGGLIHGDGESV